MDINDYKYKTELHAHCNPGSACSDVTPERLVELYKQKGCDAVAITNHIHMRHVGRYCEASYFYECAQDKRQMTKMYLEGYRRAYEAGKAVGLNVLLGMEICFFDENGNDYLVFGIDEDFIEKSIYYMDKTLADFYSAMKNDKNVIIQAHPFRNDLLPMPKEYIDGIETFNLQLSNDSKVGFACRHAFENNISITTCGSDFHHEEDCAAAIMRAKTLPKDSFELAEIIKSGDYLFDLSGNIAVPFGFKGEDL